MKAAITIICFALIGTTGCFAAQYDAINDEANNHMHALDNQCKQNMTEWCRTQYMLVQRQREQELNDLEARRHHFAHIMQEMGKGMQENARRNQERQQQSVQCTSTRVLNTVWTNCQ